MKFTNKPARNILIYLLSGALFMSGLFFMKSYSYILFHIIVEFPSIFISYAIFAFLWNSREFVKETFYIILGYSFLVTGSLDLLHTLAYYGMNIFRGYDQNLPTQLWIIARSLQALSILTAFLYQRRQDTPLWFLAGLPVTAVLLGASAFMNTFPDCFIPGKGLTPFKITSEYIIIGIIILSIFLLIRSKEYFEKRLFSMLLLFLVIFILSELLFTLYSDVYGIFNMTGHILKIMAFLIIYHAIFQVGFRNPYQMIFKSLVEKETILKEIHHRIKNNLNSIISGLKLQSQSLGPDQIQYALEDAANRIRSIYLIYEQIFETDHYTWIDAREYFNQLFSQTLNTYKHPAQIEYRLNIDHSSFSPKMLSTMGTIANEWLTNSIKHAFTGRDEGLITFSIKQEDETVTLVYEDNGMGYSAMQKAEGGGFGLQLVELLVRQLNGKLTADTESGTRYRLNFPLNKS